MRAPASPYLISNRLADLLAAIPVVATYKWATRTPEKWTESLGKPLSAPSWLPVFRAHPEFFRVNDEGKVTSRWRHGYDRNVSLSKGRELSADELRTLSEHENAQDLTRRPLDAEQIEALLKTAIEMHARAIAHAQEKRWLTPLLFALLGTVMGVVLQAALK
jgi:hypothetical protein